jgi:hypothetical protein
LLPMVAMAANVKENRWYVKSWNRCDTCWWYSLCNFQYRQHDEHTGPYHVDCWMYTNMSFFIFIWCVNTIRTSMNQYWRFFRFYCRPESMAQGEWVQRYFCGPDNHHGMHGVWVSASCMFIFAL